MAKYRESVLRLFKQEALLALARALLRAGSSIPARMAMIAITTRSSISVNVFFIYFPFC
jgi:hypothetical protein